MAFPNRSGSSNSTLTKFLPTYQQAKNALSANISNVNIGVIGDSLSVGQFALATTGQPYNQGAPFRYSLSSLIASRLGANNDNFWGGVQQGENSISAFTTYDTRVVQGASGTDWQTWQLANKTIAANFDFVSGTSKTLTFTPDNAWDSVDIYYITNTGYGTTAITGSITGTITSTSAGIPQSAVSTFTKSYGTGPITLVASGENHIIGVNFYSTTKPGTNVLRLGCGNSKSSDWSAAIGSGGWKSIDFLQKIIATNPVHLWIVQLGANDVINAVSASTYSSNMQTLINTLKVSGSNINGGDVILMTTPPLNGVSLANNLLYRQTVLDLAQTNGLLVVDNYADFVSFNNGNSNGWYSSANNVHQSAAGYVEVVTNIFDTGIL